MSWHFSQALVEDCLPRNILGGELSVLWNWMNTADAFSLSDKIRDNYDILSRYGMTFVPLTVERGAVQLMSYLEDFLVRHTAGQQQGKTQQTRFGLKCSESWQMSLPGTSLPKTYKRKQLTTQPTTSMRWVTKQEQFSFPRKTWVQTTFGNDIGYLHTPTTQGNYCADSMQKHKSCRAWRTVFGKVTPEFQEWLMGWPIGWTDLEKQVMASHPLLQSRHLSLCADKEAA